MLLIVGFLFCAYALYAAIKLPHRKIWVSLLTISLIIGVIVVAINLIYLRKTNCPGHYDRDIGCANALPEWTTSLGLLAGATAFLLSVAVIIMRLLQQRDTTSNKQITTKIRQ